MKSFIISVKHFQINLQDLKILAIFFLSIIFFIQAFNDLTWFPDELHGHWLIKRLILASFFSLGYLFQYSFLKRKFLTISKISLVLTFLISTLLLIACGPSAIVLFSLIVGLLLLKVRKNELA